MTDKKDKSLEAKEKEIALPKDYYDQNANVGLSGLDATDVPIPTLTVIQTNSKVRDEEGRPLIPGKFYYKALKLAYDVVEASILVITKKMMPSYEDRSVMERTYMVLGCLYPGQMPFLMYNKSSAYFATRQFIGEVKARKLPMYVLKVQLTSEKRQNEYGEWFMPIFNIVGVETDPDKIVILENLAKEYDMNQEGIRSEDEERKASLHEVSKAGQPVNQDIGSEKQTMGKSKDAVDPGDIPF
jgi:hypothetical protein